MKFGAVSHVILGLLHREARSGYEIKRIVDNSTRFFWAASYGQIYPELERLARAGLIEGTKEPRGQRRRTVYRLTAEGRAELRSWLREPDVGFELRDQGLLKLFFADALDRAEAVEVVRNMRADREHILARLRAIEARGVATGFPALALEYGIEQHEWMIDWCRRTERRLTGKDEEVAA